MSGMSDREKAFENKFAHDQELKFRAEARRNKLLGFWAAALMGKDPESYAKEVIASDFEEAGHEDVFRKVRDDLAAAGVSVGEQELRAKMSELLVEAVDQIQSE